MLSNYVDDLYDLRQLAFYFYGNVSYDELGKMLDEIENELYRLNKYYNSSFERYSSNVEIESNERSTAKKLHKILKIFHNANLRTDFGINDLIDYLNELSDIIEELNYV